MTATREPGRQGPVPPAPAPTVRRRRAGLPAALLFATRYPLITGAGAAAAAWAFGRVTLALAIAALTAAAIAALVAGAAAAGARSASFNPAAALAGLIAMAAAAAWVLLPAAGLGWARLPDAAAALAAGPPVARAGLRHRRRAAARARWAQALASELGQVEQVSAALTGKVHSERIAAPHLGIAPHAAWALTVRRWDGTSIREAVLKLPVVTDIRDPDLLGKIRSALTRRAGVAHLSLSTDPLRDEITITVLDGEEEEEAPDDIREMARDRAARVTAFILKGAAVTSPVFDDEAIERWIAGSEPPAIGEALREFTVTFDTTGKVTSPDNRHRITEHVSTQLYGVPDRLRAQWDVARDLVSFCRRRDFPDVIRHRVIGTASLYGTQVVLPFAEDEDGNIVVYPLTRTPLPHGLVIGKTGGGKTVLLVTLAIEAARQGIEIWGCDPKRIELMGLRGWPNVKKIATRTPHIVATIMEFAEEMNRRYELIEAGKARPGDFRRIILILDEYYVFVKFLADWWAATRAKDDPKIHPVLGMIGQIAAMSRSANMHMIIGVQRPDAAWFDDGARDNFGFRVSLGPLSHDAARMLWGDYNTGTDVPAIQGLCTATAPGGPVRAKIHWTPNPAEMLTGDLSEEDIAHLRSLLPEGAEWTGPLAADEPDPGFEDTAAAASAADSDPVTALLTLVRLALRSGHAYLTDAATGEAPAGRGSLAACGWIHSGSGGHKPAGKWIGCAASGGAGRRVYLHPGRAIEAVTALSEELGMPWRHGREEILDAMRASGLALTEATTDGTRGTVRRAVPGNDLGGADRQRVWDLPEDEVLGLPDRGEVQSARMSPAAEAAPPPRDPAPAPQELTAGGFQLERMEVRAGQLIGGERIDLGSVPEYEGPPAQVIVAFCIPDPGRAGGVVIEYRRADGTLGSVSTAAGQVVQILV